MNIDWRKLKLPDFGVPEEIPEIPREVYEERLRNFYKSAKCDWIVVYVDLVHFPDMHYFTEFDATFEEAVLVLGPDDRRYLLVGNEGLMYTDVIKPKVEVLLCQSFSLLGQDRTLSPDLQDLLKSVGISKGREVGICGWKYL